MNKRAQGFAARAWADFKRTVSQLFSVARVTAIEGLQQPVCLLLTFVAVTLIMLQPITQLNNFGEPGRMARDCGLAFMLVIGMFVSAFAAGDTLAAEIRRGTVAVALSKPLRRSVFLAGKFCGVAAVVSAFAWCVTFAVLFAVRTSEQFMDERDVAGFVRDTFCGTLALCAAPLALLLAAILNYARGIRFGLAFFTSLALIQPALLFLLGLFARTGKYVGFAEYAFGIDWRIVSAAALVLMLLLVFASALTALATRFQSGAAAVFGFALLFAGFMSESQFAKSETLFGRFLYSAIPDIQHFWRTDALGDGGVIPPRYIAGCAVYALCLIAFMLSLGHVFFKRRDIG